MRNSEGREPSREERANCGSLHARSWTPFCEAFESVSRLSAKYAWAAQRAGERQNWS